jgi:hypothetical protein
MVNLKREYLKEYYIFEKIISPNGKNLPQIKMLVWYGIFEIAHGYWL